MARELPSMLKMLGGIACSVGVLTLIVSCSSVNSGAQTTPAAPAVQQRPSHHVHTGPKTRGKTQKEKAKEVVSVPPPPPPTPEQMPAQPPEVSYIGGLLTIDAHNSTMNDVLAAVRRVTGATIEKPPMGGSDRVVVHLGPGQPKDVLSALFNGSRYDYIILGPMGQPGAVQRVILTAKSNMPAQSPVMANAPGRPLPNAQPQPDQQEEPDNSTESEDMTVPEQNQPEAEQPAPEQQQEQPQPGTPEQTPQGQTQQNGEDQNQQPHVKSPEELLRELQQMQQQQQNQQQQQQNQQNQPNQPQSPQ